MARKQNPHDEEKLFIDKKVLLRVDYIYSNKKCLFFNFKLVKKYKNTLSWFLKFLSRRYKQFVGNCKCHQKYLLSSEVKAKKKIKVGLS